MGNDNKKKKDHDYYVNFRGAILTKTEANRIGVGLIFGFIGIVLVLLLPVEDKGLLSYLIIGIFIFIGYFFVSPLIFKKSEKEKPSIKL